MDGWMDGFDELLYIKHMEEIEREKGRDAYMQRDTSGDGEKERGACYLTCCTSHCIASFNPSPVLAEHGWSWW